MSDGVERSLRMEKELKAAIKGLANRGYESSELYHRLVGELITIYKMDNNIEAVEFWKNRLKYN